MKKPVVFLFAMCLFLCHQTSATEYLGTTPGNGGDADSATYSFDASNTDIQLQTSAGFDLSNDQLPLAYGNHLGLYVNNTDIVTQRGLTVVGADLSGPQWTNTDYPTAGNLAIDSTSGRFKFSVEPDYKAPVAIADVFNNPEQLQLKMNNQGEAMAVYLAHDGTSKRMYATYYAPGLGWQAPEIVDNGSGSTVYDPCVAINESGDAMVAFSQSNTTTVFKRAHVRRFSGASKLWFAVEDLSTTNNAYSVNTLQLAMNNNGNAIIAYHQAWYSAYSRIFTNTYIVGSGWQGNEIIDHDPGTACLNAQVAISDNNLTVCSYKAMVTTWVRLYANQRTIGQAWVGAVGPLDNEDASSSENVQAHLIGINPYDEIIIIYTQTISSNIRLYRSLYYEGIWRRSGSGEYIDGGSPVRQYDISLDVSNSITAICASTTQSGEYIRPKHYNAITHSWSSPSTSFSEEGTGLDVATSASGDGYIVYRDKDVPGNKLVFKSYDKTTDKWTTNATILTGNSPTAYAMDMNDHHEMITLYAYDGRLYSTGWQRDIPLENITVRYFAGGSAGTTPTVTVPSQISIQVTNRKIQPSKGEKSSIQLDVARAGQVTIKVYTLQGRLVKTLSNEYHAAGSYTYLWGGLNTANDLIASGIYVIHIQMPGKTATYKVAVIK